MQYGEYHVQYREAFDASFVRFYIDAKNGPLAIKAIKQGVLEGIGLPLKDGLAKELEYGIPVFLSEDAKEGPRAFKEKREPQFKGK